MEHRADRATRLLISAYLRGTLKHFDFCNCAVGSIIGGDSGTLPYSNWYILVKGYARLTDDFIPIAIRTGYTREELYHIENAYDGSRSRHLAVKKGCTPLDPFVGLTDVFDRIMAFDPEHYASKNGLLITEDCVEVLS